MPENEPKKNQRDIIALNKRSFKKQDTVIKSKPRRNIYNTRMVKSLIRRMLAFNLDQLRESFNHPGSTVLEKIIANALKRDMEKGEMAHLDKLLTRLCTLEKKPAANTDDFFNKVEITYITRNISEIETNEL